MRKRPYETSDPETIIMRKNDAREVSRLDNGTLYFFDEFGVNLHTRPQFGSAFRGVFSTIDQPGNRERNLSTVCLIDLQGLVHYETRTGAFDGEAISDFLADALVLISQGSTVIMDNAVIHRSRNVTQQYTTFGMEFKFLPRYSPKLNPIENFFLTVRARRKRLRPRPTTKDELIQSVRTVLRELKDYNCSNLFERMRDFILVGLEGKESP